jgi:hypothetical protein
LIQHAPGLIARVTVNDIPFYRRTVDFHMAPSGPFNHMIVPGENVVTVELDEVPGAIPHNIVRGFEFRIMREEDDHVIFQAKYPDFLQEYPDDKQKLPIAHTRFFEPNFENPKPIWMDAPVDSFPSSGTQEQHDAVRQLYDSFTRADVDGFLAASELKLVEHRRFYGVIPELAPTAAKQRYGEMLQQPWDVDPYDPKELVFERRADGRAAYVTRKDGTHALQARHKTDPTQLWRANLLLTRAEGRWRIFW